MSALPDGTVTFLFTDIEGSTRLLQELGDAYGEVVSQHRRIMRDSMTAQGGNEIDTQGDAFFFSFSRARDAAAAAVAAQRALRAQAWPQGTSVRVRMGLHTGEPQVGEEGYLGIDVVRAARICAAGHGGQILLSKTTRALLANALPENVSVHDLGQQNLKDIQHERIFQLVLAEAPLEPRPLKTAVGQGPGSRAEELALSFEQRVSAYVDQQLEQALASGEKPRPPLGLAAGGLAIGLGTLIALAISVVVITLVVKLAFF